MMVLLRGGRDHGGGQWSSVSCFGPQAMGGASMVPLPRAFGDCRELAAIFKPGAPSKGATIPRFPPTGQTQARYCQSF